MSIFKRIKIALITFCIILVSVIIVFVYNIYYSDTVNKNIENNITNSDKIVLNMDDDFAQIITNTAKRNYDWTNLPLSESFKKKYNNRIGILGKDDDYTNLYGSNYMSNKEKQIVVLYVDHNYKQEEYYIHYTVNDKNELDDVEIVDKILRYDENGEEVIYKETMNGAFISNIIQLAAPYRLEWDPFDYVYVTDHYKKKWGGGFIPYFGIDIKDENNAYISIEHYDSLCSKEKQEVFNEKIW